MKNDSEWMSISDIMSGLMMVFLFITVTLLVTKNEEINQKQAEIEDRHQDIIALKNAQKLLLESNDLKIDMARLALDYSRLKLKVKSDKNIVNSINEENRQLKKDIDILNDKIPRFDNTQHNRVLENINKALHNEFDNDLIKWGATINNDNSIVFNNPKIYFDSASSEIKKEFKIILNDFFPRYIEIFANSSFSSYIKNIKIEGHTSSIWNFNRMTNGRQESYFNHMELSQERANNVLKFCYLGSLKYSSFLKSKLESSGLSFSQAVMKEDKKEDIDKSHRVTFRLIYED
ncbi:conserved hypothetical protein [Isorropodon fossajaponicum endosymbiont JTNG4]|jgi:outer membrane protein OmpA-like peptidoglycan-associated protein|uniref:OmpA family protein n=1 Tax=Isorropodon fossajaponicum symbiont TaxID=883811 RepID=UPI001915F21F|nr:OmpA family protein [Isorropodon fossajaponicum symbiont]BBB23856.1 conserved hypothetical protein [Isorropodon fossajaponicum endosymbiont JTNG4]